MPEYAWIALAFFLVASTLGVIWAGVKTYIAWRRGLPAFKRLSAAGEELNGRTAALERRIATLEQKGTVLQHDAGRLSVSLARARVLRVAVQDAKSVLDRVLVFVPR